MPKFADVSVFREVRLVKNVEPTRERLTTQPAGVRFKFGFR
jgi:hypothetical protein